MSACPRPHHIPAQFLVHFVKFSDHHTDEDIAEDEGCDPHPKYEERNDERGRHNALDILLNRVPLIQRKQLKERDEGVGQILEFVLVLQVILQRVRVLIEDVDGKDAEHIGEK